MHLHTCYLCRQQGRVGEAVALLEESLRHDATNRDAVSALAGLYGDDGRITDAENLHLTLLAARPSDPVVHNNYAAFLQKVGQLKHIIVCRVLGSGGRRTSSAVVIISFHSSLP